MAIIPFLARPLSRIYCGTSGIRIRLEMGTICKLTSSFARSGFSKKNGSTIRSKLYSPFDETKSTAMLAQARLNAGSNAGEPVATIDHRIVDVDMI